MGKLNIGAASELAARVDKLEKDPVRTAPVKQIYEIEKRHIVAIDPGYQYEVDELDITEFEKECECEYALSSNGILTIDAALYDENCVKYYCYLTGKSDASKVCKHIDKSKVTTIIITDRVKPGTYMAYALAGFENCTRIVFPCDDWINSTSDTTILDYLFKDDSSLVEILGTNLTEWTLPDDCSSIDILSGCTAYQKLDSFDSDSYTIASSFWGGGE